MDYSRYLIVTDLDGTFFGKGARLVEANLQAIERFKAGGGHITAGTGRIPTNIRKGIPTCGELFNAPAITANGAFIYDLTADACLKSTPMDPEATLAAARLVESLNPRVGMRVSTGKAFLVNRDRLNDAILRDIGGDPDAYAGEVLPLSQWRTEGAQWYKMVFRGEYEELISVRPAVEAAFGEIFEYSMSSPRFFELQKRGCTKATGLRFVAERLSEVLGPSDDLEFYLAFVLAGHNNLIQFWLEKRPEVSPRHIASTLNKLYYAPFFLTDEARRTLPHAPHLD